MAELVVNFESNKQEILDELERKMPEMLDALGNELYKSIYDFMTTDKIVDTGRLRGSISYSTKYKNYKNPTIQNKGDDFITGNTEVNSVIYGSNVEYANFVETGTSKQRARNYVRTGTFRAVPQLKSSLEKIMKGE